MLLARESEASRVCQCDREKERWQRAAELGWRPVVAKKQGNACGVKVSTVVRARADKHSLHTGVGKGWQET